MDRRKIVSLPLFFAVALTVFVSCRPSEHQASTTPVEVRLNAPFPAIDFAPFYVAKTKGWLESALQPLQAKPNYVGSFGEIALGNEALATNRIDMLLTSEIP